TRLTLVGTAYSKHGDRRADLVSFWLSNQKVVSVTPDGRLHALAPGRATLTAKAGPASATLAIHVVPNAVARLAIDPASAAVRTGDVIRFTVRGTGGGGGGGASRPTRDVPGAW